MSFLKTINPAKPAVSGEFPYADYGILPGVAQQAQDAIYVNPHLNPQPYFSSAQNAAANWFTNRVHLAPLGNALSAKKG